MRDIERYREQGYVALDALFAPAELDAFYVRMRDDLRLGEGEGEGSPFTSHSPLLNQASTGVYSGQYAPLLAFLWRLTPRIEQATGCKLLPTYSYFRLYRQGDICRVHNDRPACEHSLSLTLAYADDVPWPLSVATRPDPELRSEMHDDFDGVPFGSVAMRPGDGVLYQGIHHRHGRIEPNPNRWSAHLFLHWVDAAGRYRDQAFDRPTIDGLAKTPA